MRQLFKTQPHGAHLLTEEDSDQPLHNRLFTIGTDGSGSVTFTGEELISLCRQFSKYAAKQDAMNE